MKAQNLWRSFALLLAAALLLAGIPAVSAISQEGIKEYPAEGGNIYVDGNTVVDADETITKVEIPRKTGSMRSSPLVTMPLPVAAAWKP